MQSPYLTYSIANALALKAAIALFKASRKNKRLYLPKPPDPAKSARFYYGRKDASAFKRNARFRCGQDRRRSAYAY